MVCACTSSQPAQSYSDKETAYLQGLARDYLISGVVLIARGKQPILEVAVGQADISASKPNAVDTKFLIASNSKPFTALATMLLVQAGRIALDSPICTYLTTCPTEWSTVVVRNLLDHTSGIPEYVSFVSPTSPEGFRAAVMRISHEPLLFQPGSRYAYSSSNMAILGMIGEDATHQRWSDYLQRSVLAPLGLRQTGVATSVSSVANLAVGYTSIAPTAETTGSQGSSSLTGLGPAAGMYSTVEDLLAWREGATGAHLLNRSLTTEMLTPWGGARPPAAPSATFGLGWELFGVDIGSQKSRMVGHHGDFGGYQSDLWWFPDENLTAVMLSNYDRGHDAEVLAKLCADALGKPVRVTATLS